MKQGSKKETPVDFLSISVIVADVKEPITLPEDFIKEGGLGVIHDSNNSPHPELNSSQLDSIEFGGGGNVVLPARALGINTGLMGYVGNDKVGKYYIQKMKDYSVSTEGIIIKPEYHTDISFIPKDRSGKRAPIAFYEDAGCYFDLLDSEVKRKLLKLKPKVILISYSGLFEKGADLNGGENMAKGIKWIHENIGSIIMVDTHTYTGDPQLYDLLIPVLKELDVFFCSDDEMRLISERFNLTQNGETQDTEFLDYLSNSNQNSLVQFFGITSAIEVSCIIRILEKNKKKQFRIENRFQTTIENIFDTTGAGDSFKAGLCAYIVNNLDDFKQGKININEAIQFANLTARLYISGKKTTAFKEYQYENLLNLIRNIDPSQDFTTIQNIYTMFEKTKQ